MERYLDMVEREGVTLGPWETALLCKVVALLETGFYHVGQDVMGYVERPDLHRSRKAMADVADGPTLTVAEHRANLARVMGGG